jgi:hypothetical protein
MWSSGWARDWDPLIEMESLKFKELEPAGIEKADQHFRSKL